MSARPATGDSGLDPLPEQDHSFGPRGAGRLVARVGTSALRLGVVLAILGALALIAPWGAATAVDIACGVALATAGIAQILCFSPPATTSFPPSANLGAPALKGSAKY